MGGKYFASKSNIKNHQDIHKETLFEYDQLDIIFFKTPLLHTIKQYSMEIIHLNVMSIIKNLDQELSLFYQKNHG